MSQNSRLRTSADSFLDTLDSEIISGAEALHAWMQHLEAAGGIELLFQLEGYLRGLHAFFDVRHVPMAAHERSALLKRSFAPEIQVIYSALQHSEQLASEVIHLGYPERVDLESFVAAQFRKEGARDHQASASTDQPTPLDSMARLVDCLEDIRVLVESVKDSPTLDYRVYLSLGHWYQRELRSCRYIDSLLNQRFCLQYDRVDRPVLSVLLRGIPEERLRRNVASAFLYLFRLLKYLSMIAADLAKDRPLRPCLIVFALVHMEIAGFSDFVRSRFMRGKEARGKLAQATELIVYSLKIESQRILDRELVSMAREGNARLMYTRVEDSHGVLCNCLQSGIITLAGAFDPGFDARALFPSMVESVEKSQSLRQDLWSLRLFVKEALERKGNLELDALIGRLLEFRETSMRHLMYRDWGEFERFSDEIVTAGSTMEVRVLLRKLVSYVETLVQEVSKRSVLQSAEPLSGQ
jgi:hypothetical protein